METCLRCSRDSDSLLGLFLSDQASTSQSLGSDLERSADRNRDLQIAPIWKFLGSYSPDLQMDFQIVFDLGQIARAIWPRSKTIWARSPFDLGQIARLSDLTQIENDRCQIEFNRKRMI